MSPVQGLCYSENMLIVQQCRSTSSHQPCSAPRWLGRLLVVLVAATLVLGPISTGGTVSHGDRASSTITADTLTASLLHGVPPWAAEGVPHSPIDSEPHSHCALHCSLSSLVFSLVFLAMLLLAARLCSASTLSYPQFVSPPLSPPPQTTY